MKSAKQPPRIGILGGGQLARMLALKAHELGFEPHILSTQGTDPAAQVVRHYHRGELDNADIVRDFLNKVDFATFESEFLDPQVLAVAESERRKIFPRPGLMGYLQDRLSQKEWLVEAKLPTLPFQSVTKLSDAAEFFAHHKKGIVLKQRRFGYDGYGTFLVRNEQQLRELFMHWGLKPPSLIAEPICKFKRELAISVARNHSGEFSIFPLVETFQQDSRCKTVKGPIKHRALAPVLTRIKSFMKKIDYVGILAFELFDLGSTLTINELAPRVHNSAHYSLDGLSVDQFSIHLMALVDAKLSDPRPVAGGFAMVNLLGTTDHAPSWQEPVEAKLHWYGKLDNRPGRKMGHINTVGKNPEEALRLALKAEKKFDL